MEERLEVRYRGGLRSERVLTVDEEGIDDGSLRLGWDDVAEIAVEELWFRGSARRSLVVVPRWGALARLHPRRDRIWIPLDRASVPGRDVVASVERWWGSPVPTYPRPDAEQVLRRRPRPIRPAPGGASALPMHVHTARGYWMRSALLWLAFGGASAACAVAQLSASNSRHAIVFGLGALMAAVMAFKPSRLALRREATLVIDATGIRDPGEPIPVRWEEIAGIRYLAFHDGLLEHHDLLLELVDYEGWAQRFRDALEPGASTKMPDHPIRLPLGFPRSVPREDILARIEYGWGRPIVPEQPRDLRIRRAPSPRGAQPA